MSERHQKVTEWDWQEDFSQTILKQGKTDEANGKLIEFGEYEDGTGAWGVTQGGFHVAVRNVPTTYSECMDAVALDWRRDLWADTYASVDGFKVDASCNCSQGMNYKLCRHLASLMFHWEKIRGPFTFTQTEEERLQEIRLEEERKEKERLENERQTKKATKLSVKEFLREKGELPEIGADIIFKPDKILGKTETNRLETEVYEELVQKGAAPEIRMKEDYSSGQGKQNLVVDANVGFYSVQMTLSRNEIIDMRCSCGNSYKKDPYYSWRGKTDTMCGHAIAVYQALWKKIAAENPGDETDRLGMKFLSVLTEKAVPASSANVVREKLPIIQLYPRIATVRGELQLTFLVSRADERRYLVRGLEKLYQAVEDDGVYEISKKSQIHFGRETFTPDSAKWYDFIATRVRDIYRINQKLEYGSNYYHSVKTLKIGGGVPLDGSDLDVVYSIAEGGEILYLKETGDPDKDGEIWVKAGPGKLGIRLRLTEEKDSKGNLQAVHIEGEIPRLLKGNQYQYILDERQFGRISQEELEFLDPFLDIAGERHDFFCVIGRKKFPEFFYRVLPALQDSVHINLVDNIGDVGEDVLPPEPAFAFYIDTEKEKLTCRSLVSYGGTKYDLFTERQSEAGFMRDQIQEERVRKTVQSFFPEYGEGDGVCRSFADNDTLVRILTEGVETLSRFGTVKGSDAFQSVRMRPAPHPSFKVSLESGILELSIRTKDLSEAELLEVLDSYRQRRHWHRLSSGDFVDLRDADAFRELDNLSENLDISMEELIKGGVHMPEYRALYVDKLLEGHEEIVSLRDKNFKSLIRSFRTIRESDFEAPEELQETLRPYQVHGFRWASTLAGAGFSGILADEMGLGKTLQLLTFLKTQYREGEAPALVVCPASLVYNWQEECRRFTSDIPCVTLAGTLRDRKKAIQEMEKSGGWLYVTSYDLLKRDITLYEGKSFSTIILDEAQYIKNRNAAVSKAVKVLSGRHRFALTGTPVENRLSELWSIFDFLMPGFLYSASEFSSRFELPIMKRKDEEASNRLAAMTGPFILRRKKADVLKELPDKIEETRTASMEGEQRKLYDAQVVHMKKMLESFTGSGEDRVKILAEITRLRQICCDPSLVFEDYKGESAKREACRDLVLSAIDGGHRMLIFSQFTSMMNLLAEDLKREGIPFFTITGATSKKERLRLVNEFNSGDTPVFLISLRAGGTGLNLTGADFVIHYDPWWNLAVQNQATDRAHRIGQTKEVTVIRLIAAHSIEEKILELQEAKRELADAIIGTEGASIMSLTSEELLALL